MSGNDSAKPWHLFNSEIGRVEEEIADIRLEICRGCYHLVKLTQQCDECWCVMPLKVKLPNAECPIGKWGQMYPPNIQLPEELTEEE